MLSESPASLGEVAGRLGVHKSTALRLLQTLETGGFVIGRKARIELEVEAVESA